MDTKLEQPKTSGPISREQLADFLGAKTKSKLCTLLQRAGVRYIPDADGYPAITWEALNMQLAGAASRLDDSQNDDGFNLDAI
jgi:hypothetical protein